MYSIFEKCKYRLQILDLCNSHAEINIYIDDDMCVCVLLLFVLF